MDYYYHRWLYNDDAMWLSIAPDSTIAADAADDGRGTYSNSDSSHRDDDADGLCSCCSSDMSTMSL